MSFEQPQKYIDQHSEIPRKDDTEDTVGNPLNSTLDRNSKLNKANVIHAEKEHLELYVRLTKPNNEEEQLFFEQYFDQLNGKTLLTTMRNLRVVREYILLNKDTGHKEDFFRCTQNNVVLYWDQSSSIDISESDRLPNGQWYILMGGAVQNLQAISILSHELGHIADYGSEVNDERRTKKWYASAQSQDVEMQALTLEKERNAWAFAIKILKPFLGKKFFKRDQVLRFAHTKGIRSYYDAIRQQRDSKMGLSRNAVV